MPKGEPRWFDASTRGRNEACRRINVDELVKSHISDGFVKIFVDTTVLVYSRDASEPQKQVQAMAWMAHLWDTKTGILSYQVLQEFYITVTAKLQPGLDPENARKDVRALVAWRPIVVNDRVLENAWIIQDRYQISWWDALVVSAAQLADCRYLLTKDLQEYQKFGSLQVTNPFHVDPASAASYP